MSSRRAQTQGLVLGWGATTTEPARRRYPIRLEDRGSTQEVDVTVKFGKPQFVSREVIPSEFTAARISIRHAETYLSIHGPTATVPFG